MKNRDEDSVEITIKQDFYWVFQKIPVSTIKIYLTVDSVEYLESITSCLF